MTEDLGRAGPIAVFGMFVSILPLLAAAIYMFRPSERVLALMRPLTLATVFAMVTLLFSALTALFRHLPQNHAASGWNIDLLSHGLSETTAPIFVAFSFLTAAWLLVAVGFRRHG